MFGSFLFESFVLPSPLPSVTTASPNAQMKTIFIWSSRSSQFCSKLLVVVFVLKSISCVNLAYSIDHLRHNSISLCSSFQILAMVFFDVFLLLCLLSQRTLRLMSFDYRLKFFAAGCFPSKSGRTMLFCKKTI